MACEERADGGWVARLETFEACSTFVSGERGVWKEGRDRRVFFRYTHRLLGASGESREELAQGFTRRPVHAALHR